MSDAASFESEVMEARLLNRLSGPLAFSDSRILPFGLGPEVFETRPRRAGFQPSGPGETLVFYLGGVADFSPGLEVRTLRVSR